MKVLVTGSEGFIGRAVVDRLGSAGVDWVGFDLASSPAQDMVNLKAVTDAMAGCEAVIHLAAKVGHGVDLADLDAYALHNDLGTAVVLRAAFEANISRVVFASSMVVYGEGRYECTEHGQVAPLPRQVSELESGRFDPPCPVCGSPLAPGLVDESAALDPRNVYAATKVHGEHLAAAWCRETQGVVAALRFHNVYGPRMPRNTPYAGVASLFRSQLAAGQAPDVFEDGQQRRNFIHVNDVAAAVVAALRAELSPGVTPVNIGTPRVTTVAEMAQALSAALGGPEPHVSGRFRLGDVRHITADCSAAERILGWRAGVSLDDGVTDLVSEPAG